MHLGNCPFCGKECVFKEGDHPFAEEDYKCGCQTKNCRGNIKESRYYYNFKDMCKIWNHRPEPG